MILRLVALLLALGSPLLAQTLTPQPGTYEGVIINIGTTLGATFSPTMGVTLQPQPELQVQPSPFGQLLLNADGSYAMPVLDYSGEWSFDAGQGVITFTGPLSDAAPKLTAGTDAPVISLTLQSPQGDEVAADYSLVQASGASQQPVATPVPVDQPDRPNGDFKGIFAYHDGVAVRHMDVATGEILESYELGAGGYANATGLAVHILPDRVELYGPDGKPAATVPVRPEWQAGNFWLGEASPDGTKLVLNGGSADGKPADPVQDGSLAIIDLTGQEQLVLATGGGFSAGWLDNDRLYFQPKGGGLSLFDLRDGTETGVTTGPVRDAVAAPGGDRMLILEGETLSIADFEAAEMMDVPGSFPNVMALRVAPDGQSYVLAVLRGDKIGFDIVTANGTVTPLRLASGEIVSAATTLGGWWLP